MSPWYAESTVFTRYCRDTDGLTAREISSKLLRQSGRENKNNILIFNVVVFWSAAAAANENKYLNNDNNTYYYYFFFFTVRSDAPEKRASRQNETTTRRRARVSPSLEVRVGFDSPPGFVQTSRPIHSGPVLFVQFRNVHLISLSRIWSVPVQAIG